MTEAETKLPVKKEKKSPERASALRARPFETLRREVDRLFEDFDRDFWPSPFRSSVFDIEPFSPHEMSWGAAPAVDIVEKDDAYEVTAELPGLDEKNIEVKLVNGGLTIKGEKQEEKEEKKREYKRSGEVPVEHFWRMTLLGACGANDRAIEPDARAAVQCE